MFPDVNFIALFVAAAIPNIVGAIYFGPIFGKSWLSSLGMTEEDMKGQNEGLIYGSAYLLALVIAFFLKVVVELMHKDVNDAGELIWASHHTFGHGALHGAGLAVGLVVPVIVSLGLFQKVSAKTTLLGCGFWILCFALMSGVLDVWT